MGQHSHQMFDDIEIIVDLAVIQINQLISSLQTMSQNQSDSANRIDHFLEKLESFIKANIVLKMQLNQNTSREYFVSTAQIEKTILLILKALRHNYRENYPVFQDILKFEMTEGLISWKIQLINLQNIICQKIMNLPLPKPALAERKQDFLI